MPITADEAAAARRRRGRRITAGIAALCVGAMIGAAYAAVPFYRAFCQATGFDGTVRRAERAPKTVLDRKITVRFDANVRDLPWTFTPEQVSQTLRIGAAGLAFFDVVNNGSTPLTGRAAYNVVPESAGPYFLKTQCFCFSDQTIQPGEHMRFPVIYFVEPAFASDPETKPFQEVTLSYTFFPVKAPKAASAPAAG
jgi:cytochrome c oxidase assembly protein subunit 11